MNWRQAPHGATNSSCNLSLSATTATLRNFLFPSLTALTIADLSAQIVPWAPFSTLQPVTTDWSEHRIADPTKKLEYGAYAFIRTLTAFWMRSCVEASKNENKIKLWYKFLWELKVFFRPRERFHSRSGRICIGSLLSRQEMHLKGRLSLWLFNAGRPCGWTAYTLAFELGLRAHACDWDPAGLRCLWTVWHSSVCFSSSMPCEFPRMKIPHVSLSEIRILGSSVGALDWPWTHRSASQLSPLTLSLTGISYRS